MKKVAIIQARMGSSRLPGKVLLKMGNETVLGLLLKRLSLAKLVDEIVIATTNKPIDDRIEDFCKKNGHLCFRGSENDVLERFYYAAKENHADAVIRITGDCPLSDPLVVDRVINQFLKSNVDYCSNVGKLSFPDGMDVEVIRFHALEKAFLMSNDKSEREHVTTFIRNNLEKFSHDNVELDNDYSFLRLTLDEASDFKVLSNIHKYFSPNIFFSLTDILNLYNKKSNLFSENEHLNRNEGSIMSNGQKLYRRAKEIIPSGNMLLSKKPEMFLPERWPAYFSKAKDCHVWDLDGNKFVDMSIMGIGTNILGYGNPEIDEAVLKTVKNGNMSTLNCPEEVHLAEKLIEINPWSDMVKLARTGGEINAAAIRLARAFTKRDKVAICGYHGWHDWYLSTNLTDNNNLSNHLLPGLDSLGVPSKLKNTTLPFTYNKIEDLEKIILENKNNVAAVMMEVCRNEEPKNNFLHEVRKLTSDHGIVLIFDECTSGFRETFGGLHKKYKVEPDLAVYGKTLGNGYSITACVGIKEIMSLAEKTFMSSTFWTERIGPAAALKTLEVMERDASWETVTLKGQIVRNRWKKLAKENALEILIQGIPALSSFNFQSKDNLKYKTFITQEMLKKGFLAANSIYLSTKHTDSLIDAYFEELSSIFLKIADCENGKLNIDKILEVPVCQSGFKRLN